MKVFFKNKTWLCLVFSLFLSFTIFSGAFSQEELSEKEVVNVEENEVEENTKDESPTEDLESKPDTTEQSASNENEIEKPKKYITCVSGKIICPGGETAISTDPKTYPICLGKNLAVCKNFNGSLKCDELGTEVSVYSKKITCEEDSSIPEVSSVVEGDFNNDEKKDIAYRIPETGDWYVASIDEDTKKFATNFFGTWSKTANWLDVKVGDFDNDGFTDDILAKEEKSERWWVSISDGHKFTNLEYGNWPRGFTWVDSQIGDFDNDGFIDDVAGRDLASGTWIISLSNGKTFENKDFGEWELDKKWFFVRSGDFDGDGFIDDIAGIDLKDKTFFVAASNGKKFENKNFGNWGNILNLINIDCKDLNGDGIHDFIGRDKRTNDWYVAISDGKTFTNSVIGKWENHNWNEILIGNFNGDNYSDLLGVLRIKSYGWLLVSEFDGKKTENKFYGGPTVNLNNSLPIGNFWNWPPQAELNNMRTGDFNGDGIDDIAARVPNSKEWIFLLVKDLSSN